MPPPQGHRVNPHLVPPAIAEAVQGLRGADGIDVLTPSSWNEKRRAWGLKCRLRVEVAASGAVEAATDWIVFVEPGYPAGGIEVFPAARRGVEHTFPHQKLNQETAGDDWRTGALCLDTVPRIVGESRNQSEPKTAAGR